jgi:Rrf2 family protein
MRVSAKVDYALRAGAELAAAAGHGAVKGERIAQAQKIPFKFLENILLDLKHAGLVQSQRGAEGGYWLAKPPEEPDGVKSEPAPD